MTNEQLGWSLVIALYYMWQWLPYVVVGALVWGVLVVISRGYR